MDGSGQDLDLVEARMLQRLAARACQLADDLADAALEAETPQDKALLAAAFAKVSRSARQSLALKAKLLRDTEVHDHNFAAHRERRRQEAVARRRNHVQNELTYAIWSEHERDPDLAHEITADLHEVLHAESRLATFLEEPVDQQIARLKALFDVDGVDRTSDDDEQPEEDASPPESCWNLPDDDVDDDAWLGVAQADPDTS